MPKKFGPEMKARALRMLAEAMSAHPNKTEAVRHVGGLLGVSPETLRTWARREEIDAGLSPGVTSEPEVEIRRL
jgi:transposase